MYVFACHLFLCSFLSGHCTNNFLFKIKKSSSPLCSCLAENETINHVIFDCESYSIHRSTLIVAASNVELSWPIPLSSFALFKPLWLALIQFLFNTKRFSLFLSFVVILLSRSHQYFFSCYFDSLNQQCQEIGTAGHGVPGFSQFIYTSLPGLQKSASK